MTSETISIISAAVALLAAAGSWGAVVTQRRNATDTIRSQINIAARTSRASVVSANRQKWIDAIREDVADFIAARSERDRLQPGKNLFAVDIATLGERSRQLGTQMVMLRARIEMRLNHGEDDHLALLSALSRYAKTGSAEDDALLRTSARKIFSDEWKRLKKEASGIDPFVKEGSVRQ